MAIKLTNTLSGKKEDFKSIADHLVKIYTCGPTVYNYAHIGNLRAYVFSDLLRRAFEFNGYKVEQIINITDVGHLVSDEDEGEDKLEKGAKREGKTVWEVAKFYEEAFYADLKALNILPATNYPKATDHIQEMIDFIKILEQKGFTYLAGGNVYFDTTKFEDYGKLAKLNLDPEAQQSRVEVDPNKKNPFDFVLWFTEHKYESHAMEWDSPWGKGFPGWHIECSAMATKYLGEEIDIHTGGIDHIPVHHTNEIAQSEAAFGHRWVNYWLHSEFLTEKEGAKMAKSAGNFLRLQTLVEKGYDPLDYRYYLLTGHYRSQMMFSYEGLDSARNSLRRVKTKIAETQKLIKDIEAGVVKTGATDQKLPAQFLAEFSAAIDDDLNTAIALSILWKTLDSTELSPESKIELIEKYDKVFGLDLLTEVKIEIPGEITALAEKRIKAREEKNWAEADRLREEISTHGYDLLDTKDGYQIRKK